MPGGSVVGGIARCAPLDEINGVRWYGRPLHAVIPSTPRRRCCCCCCCCWEASRQQPWSRRPLHQRQNAFGVFKSFENLLLRKNPITCSSGLFCMAALSWINVYCQCSVDTGYFMFTRMYSVCMNVGRLVGAGLVCTQVYTYVRIRIVISR